MSLASLSRQFRGLRAQFLEMSCASVDGTVAERLEGFEVAVDDLDEGLHPAAEGCY